MATIGRSSTKRSRSPSKLNHFVRSFLGSFKYLTQEVDTFVKETMVLPVIDEKSGIRVDFIFSFSPNERQAIERARHIPFGRAQIKFATLEEVVIHKIIAGRPRDMEDVQSVILRNPGYDSRYIEKWLAEFDAALDKNYADTFAGLQKELK